MKKTNEVKTNKGITLIALVITIIVMLILVAVTITMAVNGGLFDYAGKATGDTNNAIRDEQQLASGKVTIDNTVYNTIDEYLTSIKGEEKIKFTVNHVDTTTEYTAKKGQTWEQWVAEQGEDSIFFINEGENIIRYNGVYSGSRVRDEETDEDISKNAEIKENVSYYIWFPTPS